MNNQITARPNKYDFGDAFNYAVWPKDTDVTLTNVNWNNDYRDVNRFASQAALDSWINAQPYNLDIHRLSQTKFQSTTIDINAPINVAMQFNYLRAANPVNPVAGDIARNYYYFITDIAYIAGNNTRLTLQLDVWQTFIYEVQLGLCYVERSHLGIANENAFDNYGRDYLAIPEGLDVGGEYRIVKTAATDIMTIDTYSVLVISAADLTKNPGTVKAPKLYTAKGSIPDGIVSGASFYVFPTPADYLAFQKEYLTAPWVTQAILSITMIPSVSRYHAGATLVNVAADVMTAIALPGDGGVTIVSPPDFTMYEYPTGPSQPVNTAMAPDWRDTFLNVLPTEYRTLKKFLTYPYSVVELTTWAGQPLAVRPEAWADDDATVRELAVMVPPGQRVAFMPLRYNGDPSTVGVAGATDDAAESLDFATTLSNFPSAPLVNNMAIGYLAANKNGLTFQRTSADWSQQRALMGAQATEDVSNADIGNTARQAAAGITASGAQSQLSQQTGNTLGLIGGALGTVGVGADAGTSYGASTAGHSASGVSSGSRAGVGASLNPMALAGYDATATIKANATAQAAAIDQAAAGARANSSIQTAGAIRDTNVSLARRSAQGDYMNTIAGVNAKVQDAMLNQPSTSGQFGGDALNIAHNKAQVSARFKLLDNSAVKRVGNFWLRYGYAVQQFAMIPDDFMCMSKFTYWKLSETYITQARIPEMFKQAIRGIFEKGVTVWADPSYIGTTALSDNEPRSGVSY